VCEKLIKNSKLFGKNVRKLQGGHFLTHTVYFKSAININVQNISVTGGPSLWRTVQWQQRQHADLLPSLIPRTYGIWLSSVLRPRQHNIGHMAYSTVKDVHGEIFHKTQMQQT